MRKVKLEMQVSLDGFALDVDGKTDWMVWSGVRTGPGTKRSGAGASILRPRPTASCLAE